jgi:hypothetical protein
MWVFKELDGTFSWRKGLTALIGFIYVFAVIGYLFGLPELPKSYQWIISGVFTFYFTKELFKRKT